MDRIVHSRHRARGYARRFLAAAVALSLVSLRPVLAADSPLTLETALRIAAERSRLLVAQDFAAAAARERAVSAGRRPDPTLTAGIDNLPITGPDPFSLTRDFMTARSLGVAQELTRDSKRAARSARFDREALAAEAGRELALADLQQGVARAWLNRYYQERLREVQIAQRDEARLQIEAADVLYRSGRGAQADGFAARSAVAQIEDRIAATDRQIATARTQLARWVGAAADQPLGELPNTDAVRIHPEGLEPQLAHHPRLLMMARQEDVARADADIARADKQPDWSVELKYSQRGSAYSNMVSLNVSIPLQWDRGNRQDRELAARLATVEQLRAQREEAVREHVAEVHSALLEWQSDRERLTRYDRSLIPLSAQATRAAVTAYRTGAGNLTAVLQARRVEIDTRMERIRLEMETAGLWAQLEYLIPAGHDVAMPRR